MIQLPKNMFLEQFLTNHKNKAFINLKSTVYPILHLLIIFLLIHQLGNYAILVQ